MIINGFCGIIYNMKFKDVKGRKEISSDEQKKLMLDMLKYVDDICRKNNIKYSLIGGTLIGAVRHRGFIPWDDDIDVILTKGNYEKLKKILDSKKGRYQTLKFGEGGEHYTFTKLIDKKTQLFEERQRRFLPEYGVFLDLFYYCPTASNKKERIKHCREVSRINWLIVRGKNEFHFKTLKHNLIRLCEDTFLSNRITYKMVHRMFLNVVNKYDEAECEYVMSGFPAYGLDREIQLKKDTDEYIDVEFEDMKAMIFKNYDNILKTTYGNYMKMPPKSERTPTHGVKVWWREDTIK